MHDKEKTMANTDELIRFDGRKVLAEVGGKLRGVEDIDSIREFLKNKYGADSVVETQSTFVVNGKPYIKPWLPRTRTGIFNVCGAMYYIETLTRSSENGRIKPRRSFFPLSVLSVQDNRTLIAMVNEERNEYVRYTIIDE